MGVKASLAGKVGNPVFLFFFTNFQTFFCCQGGPGGQSCFFINLLPRGCGGKTSRQQRHSSGDRQPGQVKWECNYKQYLIGLPWGLRILQPGKMYQYVKRQSVFWPLSIVEIISSALLSDCQTPCIAMHCTMQPGNTNWNTMTAARNTCLRRVARANANTNAYAYKYAIEIQRKTQIEIQ